VFSHDLLQIFVFTFFLVAEDMAGKWGRSPIYLFLALRIFQIRTIFQRQK